MTTLQLVAEIQALRTPLAARDQQLLAAQARIAALDQRPPAPPTFVTPNTPPRAPQPRRTRDPRHHHGRRSDVPTAVVEHAVDQCPDCQRQLTGQRVARRRQVIDLPPPVPVPVPVTEHQIITRSCCLV